VERKFSRKLKIAGCNTNFQSEILSGQLELFRCHGDRVVLGLRMQRTGRVLLLWACDDYPVTTLVFGLVKSFVGELEQEIEFVGGFGETGDTD
jgi:hypothetical protein